MRQIKFRGKGTRDDKQWVYGDLIQRRIWGQDFCFIRIHDYGFDNYKDIEVDPDTVGQYTGLKDKNGVEICGGDIVDHYATKGYVIFEDGMFALSTSAKVNFGGYRQPLCYVDTQKCEVIGNIHENGDWLNA